MTMQSPITIYIDGIGFTVDGELPWGNQTTVSGQTIVDGKVFYNAKQLYYNGVAVNSSDYPTDNGLYLTLTDLTNTNWVFNKEPELPWAWDTSYNINFTSNFNSPQSFTSIGQYRAPGKTVLRYNTLTVYGVDEDDGGVVIPFDSNNRTIAITGGTDTSTYALIVWLLLNATQVKVVDLGGTNWRINDGPVIDWRSNSFNYSISFTSNDTDFTNLICDEDPEGMDISALYYSGVSGYAVFLDTEGWTNQAYRDISITSGNDTTNPDLIVWLTNNATLQQPQPISSPGIYFGNLNISKIYFNNYTVTKMYLGTGPAIYEYEEPGPSPYDYSISVTAAGNDWSGDTGIDSGGTATIVFSAKTLGTNLINSDITVTGATKSFDAATQTLTLTNPTENVVVSCENTYNPVVKLYLENDTQSSITNTYTMRDYYNHIELLVNGQKLQKTATGEQYYYSWDVTIPPTGETPMEVICVNSWPTDLGNDAVKCIVLKQTDSLTAMTNIEELILDIDGPITGYMETKTYISGTDYIWSKLSHVRIGPNVTSFSLRYTESADTGSHYFLTNPDGQGGGLGSAFPILETIDCDPNNPYFEMLNAHTLVRKSDNSCVAMTGTQDNIPSSVVKLDQYWALYYKGTTITTGSQIAEAGIEGNHTVTTWNIYNDIVGKCSTCLVTANFQEGLTTEIKDSAFVPAKSTLAALELPASVTKIGSDIVYTALVTGEYIPLRENGKLTQDSVQYGNYLKVGNNPYYALINFSIPSNKLFSPTSGCVLLPTPIAGQYGSYNTVLDYITSAVIPASIKRIPDHFFDGKTKLTSVTLNSGLLEIGVNAFSSCNNSSFTTITIPDTVVKIDAGAFANTSGAMSLTSITFNEPSGTAITFGDQVFKVKTARSMTVNHKGNTSVTDYNWSGDSITATFNVI